MLSVLEQSNCVLVFQRTAVFTIKRTSQRVFLHQGLHLGMAGRRRSTSLPIICCLTLISHLSSRLKQWISGLCQRHLVYRSRLARRQHKYMCPTTRIAWHSLSPVSEDFQPCSCSRQDAVHAFTPVSWCLA